MFICIKKVELWFLNYVMKYVNYFSHIHFLFSYSARHNDDKYERQCKWQLYLKILRPKKCVSANALRKIRVGR